MATEIQLARANGAWIWQAEDGRQFAATLQGAQTDER